MTDVNASWDRIEEWFHRNGVADILRPPATGIEAAEVTVGHRFPADLVESLRRHDSTIPVPNSCLVPPRWILLPLASMIETWRQRTEDLAKRQAAEIDDMTDEDDEDWSDVEEGEEDSFWGWNPAWLPIAADGSGSQLVVELRPGNRYGAIGQLGHGEAPRFDGISTQPSTAALLEYAAEAFHGKGRYTASVHNHTVQWTD